MTELQFINLFLQYQIFNIFHFFLEMAKSTQIFKNLIINSCYKYLLYISSYFY